MADEGDEADDFLLLREYALNRSQAAFARLVERHIGTVYASARRQLGDPHLAEDVTQKVFVVLATKAPTLTSTVVLPAWLLAATRYVASNAKLVEARRRHHERKAAEMRQESQSWTSAGGEWDLVEPVLDAAMAELSPPYRDALALRFFDSRSMAEVAAVLKLTEEAARQRVSRAVRQLRSALQARGARATVAALPALLLAHAASAAPSQLTAAIVSAAANALPTASGVVPRGIPRPLIHTAAIVGLLGFAALVALAMRGPASRPYSPAKPPVALSVPGMDDVNVRANLRYAGIPEGELWLDVYTPAGDVPKGGWPTVVLIHGGPVPITSHPKDWPAYQHYGRLLAASGLAAVTFNYRFTSDADTRVAADDVRALLVFVRSHAAHYGLNADRIALWAFSGGGVQLADGLRTRPEYVRCAVSFYAMLPAPKELDLTPRDGRKEPLPMLAARMGKDLPEINRRLDAFVQEADRLGVALEVVEYADGVHAFDIDQDTDDARNVIRRAITFLGHHLNPS